MDAPLEIEFDPQARPATAMLNLRGQVDYRQAARLREALFEAIEASRDKNLVIELDEVTRIDTAGMAVLVEGLVATHDRGPDMFLVSPSESVTKVFELAGLEEALLRCYNCWGDFEQALTA